MAEFFLAKSSATGDMRWFQYTRGSSVPAPVLDEPDLDVDLLRQAIVDQTTLIEALVARVAVLEAKQNPLTQTPTPPAPSASPQGQASSAGKGKPSK